MPGSPVAAERKGESERLTADLGHPHSPPSHLSEAPQVDGGERRGRTSESELRWRAHGDVSTDGGD